MTLLRKPLSLDMAPTPFLLGERSDGVVARRDGSNSSGGSNFPQTGSYNWVDLVKVMVTAPLGIFQRLSQAGIDPATVVVTELLGTTITWGAEGHDRFNEALDSLGHAGIFMRLGEHTRIAGNVGARASRPEKNTRRKPSRGIMKPQDLATALVGLCKVSKQDIQHITLIGGADAAFLAAFAHFFLDLWVIIRRADQESEVLLRICPEDKIPHLEVRLETRLGYDPIRIDPGSIL